MANTQTNNEKIKSWRMRRAKERITLHDVEIATGVTIASLSNYDNGKTEPKASTIDKIEDYLKSVGA